MNDLAAGRGRGAGAPHVIPASGWKDILWRTYQQVSGDNVMLVAAGTTFYVLLAMVPALTALVSVYGLFADPAQVAGHVSQLQLFIPTEGLTLIDDQLNRLASQGGTTLGFTLAISLALSLWSANTAMKAIFQGMNIAYNEQEDRGFLKLTLITLAFTISAILSLIVVFGFVFILPAAIANNILPGTRIGLVTVAGICFSLLLVSFGIASLYKWGPSRSAAKWSWVIPGAVVCLVILGLATAGFSYYTSNFASYNKTYGSLGAMIGLMTWIWISCIILLMGAELNSEIEHQTSIDTTVGPQQVMGEREAHVADTVGKTLIGDERDAPVNMPGEGVEVAKGRGQLIPVAACVGAFAAAGIILGRLSDR